jgi:ferric-dicitrate binding protein FerR (iron transport regulator)
MEKKTAILIRKLLVGKANHKEVGELNGWFIQKSSEHDTIFNQTSWGLVKEQIWRQVSLQVGYLNKPIRIVKLYSSVAAAILVIGLTVYFTTSDSFKLWFGNHMATKYTYETGIEEIKELYLPDSTHVWLNAKSTLSYSSKYNKANRKVKLNGQAYFEVSRDTTAPFIVYTENSITRVLGTSFSVRSYSNETNHIGVTSGRVEVKLPRIKKQNYILLPGDKLQYRTDKKDVRIIHGTETMKLAAWRYNTLHFESTPLKDVTATLERAYGVQIHIKDNSIAERQFKGTFENPDLDKMLRILGITMGLDITKTSNGKITINSRTKE